MTIEPMPWWNRKGVVVMRTLMVFICTGTLTARIGSLWVEAMGIERFSWQYFVIFLVGLLPIYNVLLLPFAFIFGRYSYFRSKQIRIWRWITKWFR